MMLSWQITVHTYIHHAHTDTQTYVRTLWHSTVLYLGLNHLDAVILEVEVDNAFADAILLGRHLMHHLLEVPCELEDLQTDGQEGAQAHLPSDRLSLYLSDDWEREWNWD